MESLTITKEEFATEVPIEIWEACSKDFDTLPEDHKPEEAYPFVKEAMKLLRGINLYVPEFEFKFSEIKNKKTTKVKKGGVMSTALKTVQEQLNMLTEKVATMESNKLEGSVAAKVVEVGGIEIVGKTRKHTSQKGNEMVFFNAKVNGVIVNDLRYFPAKENKDALILEPAREWMNKKGEKQITPYFKLSREHKVSLVALLV